MITNSSANGTATIAFLVSVAQPAARVSLTNHCGLRLPPLLPTTLDTRVFIFIDAIFFLPLSLILGRRCKTWFGRSGGWEH